MKTQVYSWRLSAELKADLEREARARKMRISSILDLAVREWLAKSAAHIANDEMQKKLHAAVAPFIGAIRGGNPRRSEMASQLVRKELRRKYGR
jgi:hypothetical protein